MEAEIEQSVVDGHSLMRLGEVGVMDSAAAIGVCIGEQQFGNIGGRKAHFFEVFLNVGSSQFLGRLSEEAQAEKA